MACLVTNNAAVAGVAATLPVGRVTTEETAAALGVADIRKVVALTGIRARHVAPESICTSDLCVDAAERLLKDLGWERGSVESLIFVTQTPDYTLPATACLAQHRLGLSQGCAAFDVNQGCSGFVYGLSMAASLVEAGASRVLLLAGDTSNKYVSTRDKSAAFLFGDAGTATAIERGSAKLRFVLGTDGAGAGHLIIPAGRFREPGDANSHLAEEMEPGNFRNRHQLYMNGAEVMNFALRVLPPCWKELTGGDDSAAASVDAVVMHQANQFILDTVAKRLKIPAEKVPSTLADFGNTSSASIPLTMAECLRGPLAAGSCTLALLGFGVGWSWAGCIGDFGPAVISETALI